MPLELSNETIEMLNITQYRKSPEEHRSLYLGSTYSFFVGWLRYGNGFLAAAASNDKAEGFVEKFEDLDAGDMDASWAYDYIVANADYWATAMTPSESLKAVEDQIK